MNRISKTLGIAESLIDLQGREQVPSGTILAPLRSPAGVKSRQADLEREAAEALAKVEEEKRRIGNLVETTRSLQQSLQKARQRREEVAQWLDGFTPQNVAAGARDIGRQWDGAPKWQLVNQLAGWGIIAAHRDEVLSGAAEDLATAEAAMARHIEANREELRELGFFEQS